MYNTLLIKVVNVEVGEFELSLGCSNVELNLTPPPGECLQDFVTGGYYCEISAWCPVENDEKLSSKTPVLKDTEKFTVYIKNSVAFPYFGRNYRKNNILSESQPD